MDRVYRVLHIVDSLAIGGTERQLILNLAALDHTRFVSSLCYLREKEALLGELSGLGVQTFCLKLNGKRQWVSTIRQLVRFIKTEKVDLVHTNLFEAGLLGGIAARLSGIPSIATLTSPYDSSAKFSRELRLNRLKLSLARFLGRTTYRTCYSHFIAVSEQVKNSWVGSGIEAARMTVIPRGVNRKFVQLPPCAATRETVAELCPDGAYPILLNVGRLIPHKGQRFLLEAMPSILEHYPKAKLLIAGDGPLKGELEAIRKNLGLEKAVFLLGHRKDVKELLLASDIFVFPSLSEGFPGALLEAAGVGKPCICSDIVPVLEIIEDEESGLLVSASSSHALVQAILRLSSDTKEAQALGRRARETVLNKFLIDNTVKKLEALYTRILSS